MLFWLAAAALTLLASLAVLMPLSRRSDAEERGHDIEVYRDQLNELERDAARGLIRPDDAEEARTEIARRMIRASEAGRDGAAQAPANWPRVLGAAAVLAVPLVSWGLYSALGSPDLPSQPLSARLSKNPTDSTVEELVVRAEAHLRANPQDGKGWDVLAPIYLRMGRAAEAVTAYTNAIRLEGATAVREAGLGEAIINTASGLVTADAEAALDRALAIEPGNPKAAYYLAMARFQEGRLDEAAAAWRVLAAGLPADSNWREAAMHAASEADRRRSAGAAQPGPSEADVAAAEEMAPADRTAMIETMVASLDERLRQNPRDAEGWMRLVRSYVVLGRGDEAREALARAVSAFGKDSAEAAQITAFAASLGITATE